MKIGKFKEVDIRELWKHEQYDFSAWLAKEENIEELNELLGLTLIDVSKEAYVGTYRCDILAKDETTGINVIIENQLEQSNHEHLGKIITYASGLNAKVIVWIVKQAREEHRSAIEWLNNNTNNDLNFFLIELHAYRIDDSNPAPKFEIVEKPNNFIKNSKVNGNKEDLSKSQAERLEFWELFNQEIVSHGKPFNVRKPTTDHWYSIAVGTSKAHIDVTLVNKDNKIGVGLWISDNKELFDDLYENKDEIEQEVGFGMIWDRKEDTQKASSIMHYIKGLDFDNHSNYKELMDEVINKVVMLKNVLKKYIR